MAQFLGEVRWFSFPTVPQGWASCSGQLLPINQNQALFSLLGTTYGGNGVTSFALPDLRGRAPVHMGPTLPQGAAGGAARHTLTVAEMPGHTHPVTMSSALATLSNPAGALLGKKGRLGRDLYSDTGTAVEMHSGATTGAGAGQSHENMQPYITFNACICITSGIFPSQN
jgi:microcystin-dependent protein